MHAAMAGADIPTNKAALASERIRAQGQVIKADNGNKGFNFVHIQNGTGAPGNNPLIERSKGSPRVGDKVSIARLVLIGRDCATATFIFC